HRVHVPLRAARGLAALRHEDLRRLHPQAAARHGCRVRHAGVPRAAQLRGRHAGAHDPEGLALGGAHHRRVHRDGHPRGRPGLDAAARPADDPAVLRRGRRGAVAGSRGGATARGVRGEPQRRVTGADDEVRPPAERDAASRARARAPEVERFRSGLSFELDDFQLEACRSLEEGRSVLVAAPTGAGKTIVAEFAVHLAMQDPRAKAFYTTPMKALSNQKFTELAAEHGPENVGLLTGDTNINASARIVVMTTEVLRNMLYDVSPLLRVLDLVMLVDVHYLADRFRGAVWEEVFIHFQREVRMVSHSSSVSNAEEYCDWLQALRGDTDVIVSERRP